LKGAAGLVFGLVWLIIIMMIGFIVVANLEAHANDSEQLTGDAGKNWTNFITFVWIAFGILAMTPLVAVAVIFLGIFRGAGGVGEV